MTILYLDATAGISGDMTVAALLDLGMPLEYLRRELAKLELPGGSYRLETGQTERRGMIGRTFTVQLPDTATHDHHHHRRYADIREMIAASSLAENVKESAQRIFLKLAEAEGAAHQAPIDEVRFHEVGAVDSIVDIVGTAIGLDWLGAERIFCSSVPLGGGFVETAHGRLPIPAPATALLMKGLLVHGACGSGERVTPTGAAILAALAEPVATMPTMQVRAVGHGVGSRDFDDLPNILRGFLGQTVQQHGDQVVELSCNLDDVTPEVIGYTVQRLLERGALDVWTVPVQMKKQRPGMLLALLCRPEQQAELAGLMMAETGTLGVRWQRLERLLQERRVEERQTCWGMVRYKMSDCTLKPEFDDCCRIAEEQGLPLRKVQQRLLEGGGHV
jgi:hypothetical protein